MADLSQAGNPAAKPSTGREGTLVRCGLALANWSERWFPDPLVFAFLGVWWYMLLGVSAGESPSKLGIEAGRNFWTLVPFTMQMVMIIVGGYVVASTPLVRRAIHWLARVPKTPRGAITLVALVATIDSLISWGLSPIISGFLVREMTGASKAWIIAPPAPPPISALLGVGAGAVVLGSHADGHQVVPAAVAIRDQRTDPAHPNVVPLAEHA